MEQAILLSVQVGKPERRESSEGAWTSAIFKEPVEGEVWLGATNLEGDGQADRKSHGGPDKAVLAYSADCYPAWREELSLDMRPGAFGENFTISGQSERTVCLGDVYVIGEARVEVAQPRQPCWKLARKWARPDLPSRVARSGRTGWYLRVLREGLVRAGAPVELAARPLPQWPIARVTHTAFHIGDDLEAVRELATCAQLAEAWRAWIVERADQAAARG